MLTDTTMAVLVKGIRSFNLRSELRGGNKLGSGTLTTVARQRLVLARRTLLRAGVSALTLPMLPRKARAGQASFYMRKTQTRMPFWGSAGMAGGGQTLTAAFTCETPVWGVLPFWLNGDLAAHTIGSVAVAPTVVLNDTTNPVNPAGQQDVNLFVPVTIGGRRSGTIPAATQGNTGIFPSNDRVHGLLLGDITPVQSLPRMDGTLPLVPQG